MFTGEEQAVIRMAIFDWLRQQSAAKIWLTRKELRENFSWHGRVIPLMDLQKGIWNPKDFTHTLSVTSTFDNPYGDVHDDTQELFDYRYQSSSTGEGTNSKLRAAFREAIPIVLFHEFERGKYIAQFPVYVANDFRENSTFQLDLRGIDFQNNEEFVVGDLPVEKVYAERLTLQRLHQPRFRARVIRAYDEKCTVCKLRHVELLDAAHIIPDSREHGFASVNNGLALCKIHHTAYDRNVIGITPDYQVQVAQSVLEEVDGPMLEYGIKMMHGKKLELPKNSSDLPFRDNLAERYSQFLEA